MCGIAGFTGAPDATLLRAMASALRHRGPDERGLWVNPNVSLAAMRLAIMDPAHGRQPMASEDGRIVVVFNGEIYNAPELRETLRGMGHRFYTTCDTEILPHLYEEYGENFVERLEGEFAIAVWDDRRRRLVLSRDRLGIKPLVFTRIGSNLAFASELKGLLPALPGRPTLSPQALSHYLSLRHVPAPLSIYSGVESLSPGEQVVFVDGRLTRRSYWRLEERVLKNDPIAPGDETSLIDELERRLLESVRSRLKADASLGVLLSGGLDSSLVLAMAAREAGRALDAFTLAYRNPPPGKQADQRCAREVARLCGARHHEREIDADDFIQALPAIVEAFDEPFAGVVSPWFVNQVVARRVRVCLSGDGADELFGSYLAHRLAMPLHHLATRGIDALRADPSLATPFENQLDMLERRGATEDGMWRSGLFVFSDEEKAALLSPEVQAAAGERSDDLLRRVLSRCEGADPQNRQQWLDCMTLLPDQVLTFNDRLSMAHSVEMRVPFLNHTLVEFVSSLPGELKIRRGVCKWALKEVARRWLPAEIVDRAKEGFIAPVREWQQAALRPLIHDTLAPARLSEHGVFRPEAVADLLRAADSGQTELQYKVWTLFCFQLWHDCVGVHGAERATSSASLVEVG